MIGDVVYADDTMIAGEEEEAVQAEQILFRALEDWEEKVNTGKTERLRAGGQRAPYDVRSQGEILAVRHVGGWLSEDGRQEEDTSRAVARGRGKIGLVMQAWRRGGVYGRGTEVD